MVCKTSKIDASGNIHSRLNMSPSNGFAHCCTRAHCRSVGLCSGCLFALKSGRGFAMVTNCRRRGGSCDCVGGSVAKLCSASGPGMNVKANSGAMISAHGN